MQYQPSIYLFCTREHFLYVTLCTYYSKMYCDLLQTAEDCKCACVQNYHVICKNKRSLDVILICWRFSFKGSMHKSKPFTFLWLKSKRIYFCYLSELIISNKKILTSFKDSNFPQSTLFHQLKYKTLKYAIKFAAQFFVVSDTLTSSALVSKTLTWKSWVCRSSSNQ